jgi:hypothetical protein
MNQRPIAKRGSFVPAFALCTSLVAYYYAKSAKKDTTPLVMIGGFVGALLGEVIAEAHQQPTPMPISRYRTHKKQIKKIKQK